MTDCVCVCRKCQRLFINIDHHYLSAVQLTGKFPFDAARRLGVFIALYLQGACQRKVACLLWIFRLTTQSS